jgi:hypothetical protein
MTTYIGWYDPSKTALQQRLTNAVEIFAERRGYRPALVLVNDAQAGEITAPDGIEVEARHTVAADTSWLALRGAQGATGQLPLIGGDV